MKKKTKSLQYSCCLLSKQQQNLICVPCLHLSQASHCTLELCNHDIPLKCCYGSILNYRQIQSTTVVIIH